MTVLVPSRRNYKNTLFLQYLRYCCYTFYFFEYIITDDLTLEENLSERILTDAPILKRIYQY